MEQEIKNGEFEMDIDWGNSKDKTVHTKTIMVYGRPKLWKRIFKRKTWVRIGLGVHVSVTIDGVTYLY